jgi:phosphonate transport system ATP-binding protein
VTLDLADVTVTYGATTALDGVTLHVDAGEQVALIGPSGAGKTTLLGLAGTAVAPTAGTVAVLGTPVHPGTPPAELRALRRRIATVHQDLHLVPNLQVVHNVNAGRLGRWSTARALLSLLRPQGLAEVEAALDAVGIGGMARRRTAELSGGQRQRVAVARVLVADPDLVLADEPVASLDPARAEEVLRLLTRLAGAQGRTLLVSLHAFDLAVRHLPRVVGLRRGRVLFDLPGEAVTAAHASALYELADDVAGDPAGDSADDLAPEPR